MEDFDFDKLFADKMRRAGAPDLSDEDWERLTPKLDAVQRKRWRVLPLWWLGALTGLLLCSNFAWWYLWQQSQSNHDALRNEWQQIQHAGLLQRDTTWSKVVVYQYDTIYRTVVYRSVTDRNTSVPDSVGMPKASYPMATENAVSGVSTVGRENSAGQNLSALALQNNQADPVAHELPLSPKVLNTENLPIERFFLKTPPKEIKAAVKDLAATPAKRSGNSRQPILIPLKFRIGAGGGLAIPAAPHLSGSSGFVTGLSGEIAFSERLALTLDAAYSGVLLKGTLNDEALGLSPFPSPGDDYVLKYFETDEGVKPILQLGAGFRYWFKPNQKLSPYLGLGYGAQWHPAFELKLEYINSISNVEEEYSFDVPALSRPVSLLDFNAGLRYRFFKRFSLQTGGFYQYKLDKNQPGIPHYWGLKSSVFYAF